jgi:hypothetical protein
MVTPESRLVEASVLVLVSVPASGLVSAWETGIADEHGDRLGKRQVAILVAPDRLNRVESVRFLPGVPDGLAVTGRNL